MSKPSARSVAAVVVGREADTTRGWRYAVKVVWMDDSESMHEVRLSWADHEYWSGGSKPPSRVVEAVVRAAGDELGAGGLPSKTDAATLRRLVPELDERVMRLI